MKMVKKFGHCKNCACWEPYITGVKGLCNRFPPVPKGWTDTQYPETTINDGCWEFIDKKKEGENG